ncbi:Regulatory protein recX [Corynebacterium pseudotuberculosis 267]|uniref:recombination regulator RecX n=1 Tax=Corynebacterium pseudotuberculosis TaxID=1719 RepID=UPI0002593B5B|nr:recombination regulator RecX [Corynebacterium pseudotuberculosis]AFH52205.1 Regulatory protein recX [Corynebacterium pseudotuberculosis 267]
MDNVDPALSKEDKRKRLSQALERYHEEGNELFDKKFEEAKAPVKHRALLLLDQRQRSRHELKQRLLLLDFEEELVDSVLEDFECSKLLDDQMFANEWVRQRHMARGKSRTALNHELREKGVARYQREEALRQISEDDEENVARTLAWKKARSVKKIPETRNEYDKALRRIVGVLARRGFGQSQSLQVARSALERRLAELKE